MNNKRVIVSTCREAYSSDDIKNTMSVQDLIDFLNENYYGDEKIYLSFDNGYTYGSLQERSFLNDEELNDEE